MPVTIDRDSHPHATITVTDPYTFEEWQAAMMPFATSAKPLRLLIDRSGATAPSRSVVEQMLNCLTAHARAAKDWRVAVVTPTDAGYGVARMIELTVEARGLATRIAPFRTYDAARLWLLNGGDARR
jgi:hypothetical protein